MASEEQAEKVKSQGEGGTAVSYLIMALTITLNLLLSNAAGSIWGIIESLQVASHLALFDMKTPGKVNGFNLYFVELSSYEVIDFAKIS